MAKNNEEKMNNEVLYEEDYYVAEVHFVQAPTLKELEKKINNEIEKEEGRPIEQNPFWDPVTNQWTAMICYDEIDDYGEENTDK